MSGQAVSRVTLGERRYDLDWVRILAFMLLIFYHVGMYYVTWDWHVKSPYASNTIEPLMMLTSPWRLTLLFLISGVATGYLLDAQGVQSFLGSRSIRLLVPLVFGMAVIVPPQSYLQVVEKLGYAGGYVDFWKLYVSGYHGFCQKSDCLILPTWNHLWFVAYLWVYTVVLYVVVRLLPRIPAGLRDFAERRLTGIGVLVWPVVYLVTARLGLAGRFPANHALVGDWYNHALYGGTFLLGFALAGTKAPWITLERARWGALGIAILGWAYLCVMLGMYEDAPSISDAMLASTRAVYGLEQWAAIVAVLGFARRHLAHDNAARRYLTTAIFPVYILHQTIIVVCAHSLQLAHLSPGVEGPLLVLVTAATSFMGYEAVRRVRWLRPLFGLAVERDARGRVVRKARPPVATLAPQDIN
jgi:surface polysaccharide O-acyltransferase-like enzyme